MKCRHSLQDRYKALYWSEKCIYALLLLAVCAGHIRGSRPPRFTRCSTLLSRAMLCGKDRAMSRAAKEAKMRHLSSRLLLLLAVLVFAIATSSAGTQITLGQSTIGDVLFVNTGLDSASFSFTGTCGSQANCLSGYGYYGINVGTYEMWVVGGPMGSPVSGVYPINMSGATIDFTFSFGSSYLDGSVLMENVTDGTEAPRFIGGMQISSSDLPGFSSGSYADFDGDVYLGQGPTLDQVYAGTAPSTQGFLSSGQFVPTPEPGSLLLFGSAMLGLAGWLKRKMMV